MGFPVAACYGLSSALHHTTPQNTLGQVQEAEARGATENLENLSAAAARVKGGVVA